MLPTYLGILALMLLFLLFSSWIAYIMFGDTKQGEVFTSYVTTLYQMFILFTTSNNPGVWYPAYKVSRWYSLFFVLYILLGVFFVTNLILAGVYDSFKSELAKQFKEMNQMSKKLLNKAFNLIDKERRGYLKKDECRRLFEELNKYRTLPHIEKKDFDLVFDELDDSHDFKISSDEFAKLCEAIAVDFKTDDCPSCFESIPTIYNSPFSEKLKTFVQSDKFGKIIYVILVINLIVEIIETMLDTANSSTPHFWQVVECLFGWIYSLEMGLKIYAYGFMNYWRDGQNRFDFVVTCVIVLAETSTFLLPEAQSFFYDGQWIRYLILARALRLIRLLLQFEQYYVFVATFFTLIQNLMPYLGTIFCAMCIYSSLGVQIFGGIVNAGNTSLEETDLAKSDFLLFNFNDYPNAMVTTFNLVLMGTWQTCMQTYRDLTRTSWTLVYFVSFYLIIVLLILNVIISFVLEAFRNNQTESSEGTSKTEEKERIRRNLGHKTRFQGARRLLRRMLESELEKSGRDKGVLTEMEDLV